MIGLSPFREERTPSFTITPERNLFYDFSAGMGGNVLTFIQKYNKCSFRTAVDILKQYANITEDYVDTRLTATKTIRKFKPPAERKNKEIRHKTLPPNIMRQYETDESKLKIWSDEGISSEVLSKYQVRYDPFSNRIVFPIRDTYGNIIAIKGRTLDPDFSEKKIPKYLPFQEIGNIDFLFGYFEHLEDIQRQKELILFEGEKSVMHMESWGIKNTAALLTSHLNPLQLPILIRLGIRIVFALDKNVDITKDENIRKLSRFIKIEYIKDTENLIGEKDAPIDKGFDIWKKLYEGRKTFN